ncbi:phage tail protein [Lonepinella koalarum]|uniref:phage tail protein n=1 Tax=Lonepinella koalarum TaxID=53417 RepID=UPI003F6DAB83
MYFMLGTVAFEPINLTDFSETFAAQFAEHQVLKGKPRLQAMGEKLIELRFSIRLHFKIGGVESRYQTLLTAKEKQQALALMWGTKYKGQFVITDITSTTLFTDAKGNALCREMDVSLKEFVGDEDGGLLGAALSLDGKSLLGSILPDSVVSTLSTAKQTVSCAVELYNAGKRAVDEVKNTVAIIRQFAQEPSTALAYLPSAIRNLDSALGGFGELTGMGEMLDGVRSFLPVVSEFSQEMDSIYSDLQQLQQCFDLGSNGADWSDWVTPAANSLVSLDDSFDMLAPRVSEMTAWVVLRTDETENEDDHTNLA